MLPLIAIWVALRRLLCDLIVRHWETVHAIVPQGTQMTDYMCWHITMWMEKLLMVSTPN